MNAQSARLEMGVYEARDSLMVVMEECEAPVRRRRGCCEQIPWQRRMEFTGQPSIHLHTTLRQRTERFWFQMMERIGSSVHHRTTELQTLERQQRDAVLGLGQLSQNAQGKPSTHIEFNLRYRYSWAPAVRFLAVLTPLLLLWEQPLTKTVEQLGAALLMWDGGHYVSSQLGIEEHTNKCESVMPWCTCRYLSAQRRPQTN